MSSEPGASTSQREAWEREYTQAKAYTTSYRLDFDRGVRFLLGYLEARGETLGEPVLDCGCGIGRHTLRLAARGHAVIGLEHSEAALSRLRDAAGEESLADRIRLLHQDLAEPLPLSDGSVGSVLDVTAVDNLIDTEERRRYGLEVGRVLRPGGVALVTTFALDDGYYGRWLSESPAAQHGVVEDPNTGIRNQLFTPRSLDEVFAPPLVPEVAATLLFVDEAAGAPWTRRFLLHLYRQPD